MVIKVVVQRGFGGFMLSEEAIKLYNKIAKTDFEFESQIEESLGGIMNFRTSPILISMVKQMGNDVCLGISKLEIVDIPDDAINPYIDDYDGQETVREGRSW